MPAWGSSAAAQLRLLERCDALRRPQRFADMLLACECDARGRLGLRAARLPAARAAAAGAGLRAQRGHGGAGEHFAALGQAGPQIGEAIHAARVEALRDGFGAAPG